MGRPAWVLLLLLLATNATWYLLGSRQDPTPDFGEADVSTLEETIVNLQGEVAHLRREYPILVGLDESPAGSAAGRGSVDEQAVQDHPDGTTQPESAKAKQLAAEKAAQSERSVKARKTVTAMIRMVMQVEDAALRAAGLADLHAALEGEDDLLVEYALSGLWSLRDAGLERSQFQGIVRSLLTSKNGGIRRSALYAYAAMNPDQKNLRIALQSATDPEVVVRQHSAKLLTIYGGRKLGVESAAALIALLGDKHRSVRRGTVRGLSGTEMPPELQQKLIEVGKDPGMRHEVVYHGLSTMREKPRIVVDALFAHLEDPSRQVRGRAHWGLQRGVAKAQEYYVASQYAERLAKFVNPKTHKEALKLIVRYGDDSLAPQLTRFSENELVDPDVRELAGRAAQYLITKKRR